jgi:proteasome lid subunit RPN8/RPN11
MRSGARDAMVARAIAAAPHECCGLLVGSDDEIVEAAPARNAADDPATRFLIDPADHVAALRAARSRGLDVVGFYHSHPASPPEPSPRDVAEFSYPGHLYAIVSLRTEPAEVRLFRFDEGNFRPIALVTVR